MIRYVREDVFTNLPEYVLIPHVVNDSKIWGAGFTAAIDKYLGNWPRSVYRTTRSDLGVVSFSATKIPGVHVANMCAQHGVGRASKPIRYDALDTCLAIVADETRITGYPIRTCRFGTGLAGGSWDQIEPLILKHLSDFDVTICDLP